MVPNAAVPKTEPSDLKNVFELVATPISLKSTAF